VEAVIPALLVPSTHLSRTPLRLPQCDATQLKAPSSFRVDLLTKYCVVLISIYHFWLNSCFHIATCMIMSTPAAVTLPSRRRVPRHRTGSCRADRAIGARRQGDVAAGGVAPCSAGSLVRGRYIDDRHVSVPGIDRYGQHARAMHARSHRSNHSSLIKPFRPRGLARPRTYNSIASRSHKPAGPEVRGILARVNEVSYHFLFFLAFVDVKGHEKRTPRKREEAL